MSNWLWDIYRAPAALKHIHVRFPRLYSSFLLGIWVIFAADNHKAPQESAVLFSVIIFTWNPIFFFYQVTEQQRARILIKTGAETHTNQSFCGCVWFSCEVGRWFTVKQRAGMLSDVSQAFLCQLDMFILRVCATVEPETRQNTSEVFTETLRCAGYETIL